MNRQEKVQDYYKEKYLKNTLKEKYNQKIKTDIIDRLIDNLRKRAYPYTRNINLTVLELLGCSRDELKNLLEKKFTKNMTFENYGEWEIDHIRPLASFNLKSVDEIKICFNHNNIQPLWKSENRSKKDKYYNIT